MLFQRSRRMSWRISRARQLIAISAIASFQRGRQAFNTVSGLPAVQSQKSAPPDSYHFERRKNQCHVPALISLRTPGTFLAIDRSERSALSRLSIRVDGVVVGLAGFQRFVVDLEHPREIPRQFVFEHDFLVADKRDH